MRECSGREGCASRAVYYVTDGDGERAAVCPSCCNGFDEHERHYDITPIPKHFTVAVYHIERAYGGPEEGGWWYDAGDRIRPLQIFKSEDAAYAFSNRFNRSLDFAQRHEPPLGYTTSRGLLRAMVFEGDAPPHYPARRPHYC